MKTFLIIVAVWAGLGLFATAVCFFCGWRNSKADPDDAAEEDSKS